MRPKLAILIPTIAATVLLSTLGAVPPAGAAAPPLEAQLLGLVQQARAANGQPPLTVSAGLTRAAENWSDYQLGIGRIAHNPNLRSFIAPFGLGWGENVGVAGSPAAIMAAFMASPGHRANILGNYNRIGVGLSVRGDGSDFVTLDFELFPPGH